MGYCYSPEQIQTFYDLNSLYTQGYDGKGMTIMILDSFGSPTIQQDLHTFDQTFGLPDPPSFQIVTPLQTNETLGGDQSWEFETTQDVELAHTIAPGANIVLLVSPDDESQGIYGFPQYQQILTYALNHQLGQVVSFSFGVSELTLSTDSCDGDPAGDASFLKQFDQQVFQPAETDHVTVVTATGDAGATNQNCQNSNYSMQNAAWPATDPLVTAVGGTDITTRDDAGNYGSEKVWNNGGAGGGGISQLYSEPSWQKNLPNQSALKGQRGIPDIAMDAGGHFPVYHSYPGDQSGWDSAFGNSMSSPLFAGVVAIADQMAGHPLGFLNPAIYQLAGKGFHDVTTGDNSFAGVQGFSAGPGWDLATGWGTPDAAKLVPLLVSTAEQLGD